MSDWAHPDFSDPRFVVKHVVIGHRCRQEGCDRLAAYVVEYTMRREAWTYEYECGYCEQHLPPQAREGLGEQLRSRV